MVSRRAVSAILAAFCTCIARQMSADSPESFSSSPSSTIVVKRFQKRNLPVAPSQATPGQESTDDPLQHALSSSFAAGSDIPVSAPILSPAHDSPEPNTLDSAEALHEAVQLVDASVIADGDDHVSIVDPAFLPQQHETDLSVHSEPPLEEEWPLAQLATNSSWSNVHSGELFSVNTGTDRTALPYLQDSQPSTLSFSPLRRGPLFTETLEAPLQSSSPLQSVGPRPALKARPSAWKQYTSRPKSLHLHSSRDSICSRPRPSPPALRASGVTTSGHPKARPLPPPRGHYAAYPSEVSRQLASEQGAISKAASPCIAQEPKLSLLPQATFPPRRSGGLQVKRGLQHSEPPLESGPKKTIKQSTIHSGQWSKALTLWKELCMLTSGISSLLREVLASTNSAALLEQLLRRVSDTTALRYIAVLWGLFTTICDLQLLVDSISQVQLLDAIHVFQHSRSRSASVHSTNVLKALRWFSSTVKPDAFPSLHDGLFHSKSWHSTTSKREAVPLPLAFVHWLEVSILLSRFPPQDALYAGAMFLCIWSSLRFGDAQHLHLQDFYIDADSIRGVAYRTKTKRYMPFGCLVSGLCKMPLHQCWVFHWLQTMTSQVTLCRDTSDFPDYIFLSLTTREVRPMSYAETLLQLRQLLLQWGRIPPEQCMQYTLHSMKVTLLAFWRQSDFSLEARHLQGHHVFAPSSTLYGRDDIAPILTTQFAFVERVHSGWRPRTPVLRGVSYVASEPEVDLVSDDLGWVPYIASLPFFHVSYPGTVRDSTSSMTGASALAVSDVTSTASAGSGQDIQSAVASSAECSTKPFLECKLQTRDFHTR